MPVRLGASLLAEFIGSFALTFIGIMGIHWAGGGNGGLFAVALAHGLILAVCVSATMQTSGGHFNPAVTLSFLFTKKIQPVAAIGYIVIQLIGGLVAALAVWTIFPTNDAGALVVYQGTPNVAPGFTAASALLCEIIATFFLVFVIWGTAADPRAKNVGGFAIGLVVAADILGVGPISGASMNPMRSFGPTIIGSLAKAGTGLPPLPSLWQNHWIYWVGPIVGALLAGLLYHLVLWPRDEARGFDAGAVDVPPSQRPR